MKHNVLWLEIVMNNFIRHSMKISNCVYNLPYDHFCLFFWYFSMFFKIIWKIRTFAILQNCTKRIWINLYSIIKSYDIWMTQSFMNLIFSECVFNIILFSTWIPIWMKLMNFTSHLSHLLSIKSLIDLTETPFS